jgi:Fe-S-cluster containining protein
LIKQFSENKKNHKEDADISLWLDYLIEPSMLEKFVSYCKNILINGTSDGLMRKMCNKIIANADSIWLNIKPDAPEFACRKGCSWCCHQSVSVTWPELLNVVSYLQQNLKFTQLEALKKKSKEKADKILEKMNIKANVAFHKVPCLFLEGNICTIHSVRPLQCRGGFSEKEDYCKSLLENYEMTQKAVEDDKIHGQFLIIPKLIYNSAQVAMTYAMKDAGMKGSTYELTVAMSILMTKLFNGELDTIVEDDLKSAVMAQSFKI